MWEIPTAQPQQRHWPGAVQRRHFKVSLIPGKSRQHQAPRVVESNMRQNQQDSSPFMLLLN
jgi:hypothetical protein